MTDEQYEELARRVEVLEHGLLELVKLIDHLVAIYEKEPPPRRDLQ